MRTLLRYVTSFGGVICHVISGLSVIAALLWFIPAVVFFLPSVVPSTVAGIDLSGFVTAVQTSPAVSMVTMIGSFVAFLATFVALKYVGDRLYAIGRPTGTTAAPAESQAQAQQPAQQGTKTKDYLRGFILSAVTS